MSKRSIYFRLLMAAKEFMPDFTGTDANRMIADANSAALEKLSVREREIMEHERSLLKMSVDKLSDAGTLELLAAISEYLSGESED